MAPNLQLGQSDITLLSLSRSIPSSPRNLHRPPSTSPSPSPSNTDTPAPRCWPSQVRPASTNASPPRDGRVVGHRQGGVPYQAFPPCRRGCELVSGVLSRSHHVLVQFCTHTL